MVTASGSPSGTATAKQVPRQASHPFRATISVRAASGQAGSQAGQDIGRFLFQEANQAGVPRSLGRTCAAGREGRLPGDAPDTRARQGGGCLPHAW